MTRPPAGPWSSLRNHYPIKIAISWHGAPLWTKSLMEQNSLELRPPPPFSTNQDSDSVLAGQLG